MPQQGCQLLSNAAFNGRMVTTQTIVADLKIEYSKILGLEIEY